MKSVEGRFNCRCHKLPIGWRIDMICSRKGVGVCLAEMKCRDINHDSYNTVICSKPKLEKGEKLAARFGIPLMFFVRFRDGDYFLRLAAIASYREELFTRPGREDDPNATEKVVHLPIESFKKF